MDINQYGCSSSWDDSAASCEWKEKNLLIPNYVINSLNRCPTFRMHACLNAAMIARTGRWPRAAEPPRVLWTKLSIRCLLVYHVFSVR